MKTERCVVKKNKILKKNFTRIGFLILITVGIFFTLNFLINKFLFQPSENIKKLKSVEIKEYQGENLSSISDFRENSIKGPQYIDIKNYVLNIDGLVDKKLSLNYDQVLNHNQYTKVVTLKCVEGWSAKILWQGVLIKDLLTEAGIKSGSNTVIFYAVDGYSSSLPLDYIINKNIILASEMNGVNLPSERGFPFQVVAEDKFGYKWVKWVSKIEVSNDPNYKGYWESSGYNQNGDLSGPKRQN
ncbi:MAG: molybdopterin-dependent oxidoreductase [Candidatus Shapirobacteria bacterium]|nr:molybdopterin-dependent oxidoreductase [Candidatus Shapirobacteria bacterium]MDD3002756.1 molybdopterin-dependent oxidoreductase [Candidatus Shapirobacteria bacterium]MDD4383482.1 molybdopterin-dependent oxidoreductase [Candidatus Shapirobacteria bacterium]